MFKIEIKYKRLCAHLQILLKALSLSVFLTIGGATYCYATWSIIIIDPKTHKIGIAGASCTYSVYGIGIIAPGKGAIVVQAMSNPLARLKGYQMILADAEPADILEAITDSMYYPEDQQYAIVTIKSLDNPATYTGENAPQEKGSIMGKGISVQGNTLVTSNELQAAYDVAIKAQNDGLSIEETLMLALEAGAKSGGDRRCGETKALSAFLTVTSPDDNPRKPSINLVVYGTNLKQNAVEELRKTFDSWKLSHPN